MSATFELQTISLGALLALAISVTAWRLGMLTRGGLVAAAITGTIVFGLGGLLWAVPLLAFFTSSSLLSRLARQRKAPLDEKFAKGSRRDAWQVLANGGVAALILLVAAIQRKLLGCSDACFAANGWAYLTFAGSLAAANADTWATELGVLWGREPRLITTGRPVPRGTSGGITAGGSLAALGGALLVALLTPIPWPGLPHPLSGLAAVSLVTAAGLAGSFLDSWLGATIQAVYHCPACGKDTEKHPLHTCGTATRLVRGLDWLDNDIVNLACTLSGAILVWLAFILAG